MVAAAAFLAALVGFGRWVYVVGEADKNRVWWSRRAHAAVAAVVAGVAVWAAIDQAHRTAAGIVVGVLLAADVVGGWGWSLQHADWIQPEPFEPKASGASFNMALVL